MSKLFSELQFYILQGPEFDYISSLITRNSGKANLTYTPDFPTILPIKTSTILHLSDDLCSNLYSADFIYESIKCSTLKCLENYRISTKICERNEVILSISDKQKLYSYIQKNPKNADSENYWFIALYDGLDIDLPSDYLFNFYLQDVSARIMKVLNDFTEEVSSSPHKRRCLVYTPDINTVSIHPLSKIKAKSLVVMVNHHERSIWNIKEMHKRSVELNLRQEFGKLVTRCQEISTKDLTSLEVFEILENFNGNTQNTISHFSNY